MRDRDVVSKWAETGISQGLFRRSQSVVLSHFGVALIAVNAYGQSAFLSSPKELLATDPRAFAQWLETNRRKPVSADQKARILKVLPSQGEFQALGPLVEPEARPVCPLLRATGSGLGVPRSKWSTCRK